MTADRPVTEPRTEASTTPFRQRLHDYFGEMLSSREYDAIQRIQSEWQSDFFGTEAAQGVELVGESECPCCSYGCPCCGHGMVYPVARLHDDGTIEPVEAEAAQGAAPRLICTVCKWEGDRLDEHPDDHQASEGAAPRGYIRIRTPDDPNGWTAEGDLIAGMPYTYNSGDVGVEIEWGAAPRAEGLDVNLLGRAIHRVFRHGVHGPGADDGDGDLAAAILDEYAELATRVEPTDGA